MPDAHHTKKNKASRTPRWSFRKFIFLQLLLKILAGTKQVPPVLGMFFHHPSCVNQTPIHRNWNIRNLTNWILVGGTQQIWKRCPSQIGSFPQTLGWTFRKNIWNHHLGLDCQETPDVHLKKCSLSHLSLWRSQRTAWWTSLLWSGQDHAHAFEDSGRVHQPSQVPRL